MRGASEAARPAAAGGRRASRAAAAGAALAFVATLVRADVAPLARVGERRIEAAEFERRARLVSEAHWARLGETRQERRRRFLEEVLVAEALLELEASRQQPELGSPRSSALARSVLLELQANVAEVSPSDVEAYLARHPDEYTAPPAILIWRILVRDEAAARDVIRELATLDGTAFSRLARERSLDTATSMRGGSLGFVAPDGQTHMPAVRVAPRLFEAASQVKDGELVPQPVPEGDRYAVVWRRASHPPRALNSELQRHIVARVREERLAAQIEVLLGRLRREQLHDYRPELLAGFEPEFSTPASRPPRAAPPLPRAVELQPRESERGLR